MSDAVMIEEIKHFVARYFHIAPGHMSSQWRARSVARPRQIAMYLARRFTGYSLPDIGRRFGGRDHTTVLHALTVVDRLVASSPVFKADIQTLEHMLNGRRQ